MRRDVYANRYIYFVTFSCYKRRKLLAPDSAKRIVLGCMDAELTRLDGWCTGFVVMPDHVHSLIWFPEDENLQPFIQKWKQRSSRQIKNLRTVFPKYYSCFSAGDAIWQANSYIFPVHNRKKFREKIEYIHANPGRAGLVEAPCDWRYSSARWFEHGTSAPVPMKVPVL
jgi:putative transposase